MQLAQHGAAPDSAHSLRHTQKYTHTSTNTYRRANSGMDTSAHLLYLNASKPTLAHSNGSTCAHTYKYIDTHTHSRNICCGASTNPHSSAHSNKQLKTQITAWHTHTHSWNVNPHILCSLSNICQGMLTCTWAQCRNPFVSAGARRKEKHRTTERSQTERPRHLRRRENVNWGEHMVLCAALDAKVIMPLWWDRVFTQIHSPMRDCTARQVYMMVNETWNTVDF